jgi:signal transduction histidine kinase
MTKGDSGTPETPRSSEKPQTAGSGERASVGTLDVRSLRDLVASAAGAQPPATIDRPYADTLRNSVDWLWQTDAEFNLTYVSRPLDEGGDGPRESWLGRSLLTLADQEADEATPSPLLLALRARRAFRDCTVEWISEADERVRFRLTGLPFEDAATGAFAGFRGTASATSEPAEETRTARELLDLLKAALSERDQLQQQLAEIEAGAVKERLAGIAHELRTPLNAIIGFSELIRDQAFGDDPRRYAAYGGNIHRSGLKLLQLVNRILDIAEHESGVQAIEARPFDVEAVVRTTIEILADSAATAGVALYLDVADDLPRARGDRQMTRQILFHLLSLVVQQAPRGWAAGIRVAAEDSSDAGPAGVRVAIWDGPTAEEQVAEEQVAEEATADESVADETTADEPDPGDLAPTVLQHLAETMGARLEIAGRPGRGSEARLSLAPVPEDPSA